MHVFPYSDFTRPDDDIRINILLAHSEFSTPDSESLKLLWHLPLSASEFEYQKEHGISALLGCMSYARLPWVFDETTRPLLRQSPDAYAFFCSGINGKREARPGH